jgi:hypothetical protein
VVALRIAWPEIQRAVNVSSTGETGTTFKLALTGTEGVSPERQAGGRQRRGRRHAESAPLRM